MLMLAPAAALANAPKTGRPSGGKGAQARKRIADQFDTNGNGRIDPNEAAAARAGGGLAGGTGQPGGISQADLLKRFDKNGNGKLDPDEAAAAKFARDALKARGAGGNNGVAGGNGIAGGNGAAGGTGEGQPLDKKAARKQKKAKLLEQYDTNGDGKLDAEERKAKKADEDSQRAKKKADKAKKKKPARKGVKNDADADAVDRQPADLPAEADAP